MRVVIPGNSTLNLLMAVAIILLAAACSGGGGASGDAENPASGNTDNDPAIDPTSVIRNVRSESEAIAHRPDSAFYDAVMRCALVPGSEYDRFCTVEEYPYIALDNPDFTLEDILDRVVVSHAWMGDRIERLLRDAPADLIAMFGSVTGIVVASDIRPSNYRSWTGSIRIDPRYLWTTVDEKLSIDLAEDYRSSFGEELDFRFYSEFVLGDNSAYSYHRLDDESERQYEEIVRPFYALMYHELSHANDYAPRSLLNSFDRSLKIYEAQREYFDDQGGIRLNTLDPVANETLIRLAGVRFNGDEATEEDKNITAADAGNLMADDGALEFYSYRSVREDFANLVEVAMMQLHYGIRYNVGFTANPDGDSWSCSDLLVGWGVRNRLANVRIAQRAKFAVEAVYGQTAAVDQFFTNELGQETPMRVGESWCDNRVADPAALGYSQRTQSVRGAQGIPDERLR